MKKQIEWREPGIGVCYIWQENQNSWGYSTTGVWGHAWTFEEAKAELESASQTCTKLANERAKTRLAPKEETL